MASPPSFMSIPEASYEYLIHLIECEALASHLTIGLGAVVEVIYLGYHESPVMTQQSRHNSIPQKQTAKKSWASGKGPPSEHSLC
jgi:hypothetical protein